MFNPAQKWTRVPAARSTNYRLLLCAISVLPILTKRLLPVRYLTWLCTYLHHSLIASFSCSSVCLTRISWITVGKPWTFSACHFGSSWFQRVNAAFRVQRVEEFSWDLLFILSLFNGGWKICLFIQIVSLSFSFYRITLLPTAVPHFLYPNRAFHHSVKLLRSVWESGLMYSGAFSYLIL